MDWAYLAGFIDGDGSLGIYRSRSGAPACKVQIANINLEVLLKIKEFLGSGSIQTLRSKESNFNCGLYVGNHNVLKNMLPKLFSFLYLNRVKASKIMKILNIEQKENKIFKMNYSYLAGFIDAEGCFGLYKIKSHRKQRKYKFRPILQIGNKSLELLKIIQEFVGFHQIHSQRWKNGLGYNYHVYSLGLRKIFPHILHLLIVKKCKADLVNEALTLLNQHGPYKTPNDFRLEELSEKMKSLK